jgi:CRP/FNR family cyclic AMP-dependent transcriptional regulator
VKSQPLSERAAGHLRWLHRTRLIEFFGHESGAPLEPAELPIGTAPRRGHDVAAALARNPVFAVLSPERRRELAASGAAVRLESGHALFRTGDEADAVYVVLSGEVDVAAPGPDGRDVWLAKLGAGALVGEMGVLDGGPRSADVCAVSRTELWRIGRRAVLETLREEPSAALELMAMMARRLRMTDMLLQETALMDLGGRLARLLLEAQGATIALSQGEMARLIGASRERVNRKLAGWRSKGWVDLGPYGVKVLDRDALSAAASPVPSV